MALVEGTNCGFVASAPTGDPAETITDPIDTVAIGCKFVSPAGTNSLSRIYWYAYDATEEANFQVAIYSHDAGNDRPGTRLATSGDVAKGTTSGWKYGDVSYSLNASTTYWLCMQLDNTATDSHTEYLYNPGSGVKADLKSAQTELPASWGTSDNTYELNIAIAGLYAASTTGQPFNKRWGGIPHNARGSIGRW